MSVSKAQEEDMVLEGERLDRRDTILILDFGGQYCHLIGRRIREQGVYTELVPYDITIEEVNVLDTSLDFKGIILSGGPSSVFDKDAPRCDPSIFDLGIPVLGLCYGHQLIAHIFGGKVESAEKKEYGPAHAIVDRAVSILTGLEATEQVWMSHGDTVFSLPPRFEVLAHTDNSPIAAFCDKRGSLYGLQWHPEVSHTKKGNLMLRNFIFLVCGCRANWSLGNFIGEAIAEVRRSVGDGKCIVALSGGVDSSTAAVLVERAIGERLTAIFVDHGFMRAGETEAIRTMFEKSDINFIALDESKRFLKKLRGVQDPEEKRKVVGREFIRTFEEVARRVGAQYLVQGTIYPDRIESGYKRHSEKIKTHHNVAGLPTRVDFKAIIEPLKDLYKDEVRKVASLLELPEEIVWRQPFPGPGLSVRVAGEVTQEKLEIVRMADALVTEEIDKEGLNESLWQYFAVLTETKSTGVKGDSRVYGYTVAIRAVESMDGMTAMFAKVPYAVLERISTRITNEVPQISRVVYDISNKPPATIEWE